MLLGRFDPRKCKGTCLYCVFGSLVDQSSDAQYCLEYGSK